MMKRLHDIFSEHRKVLVDALTTEVKDRGGVIKVQMICGGKDDIGFDRKTIVDRLYLYKGLFDEEEQLHIMAHDKKFPSEKIEKPISMLSTDMIEAICLACDKYQEEGEKTDE